MGFFIHVFTGENGTIDGQGDVWWNMWRQRTLQFTRPNLVEFVNSRNIIISNVIFKDSPFWNIHPVYCRYNAVKFILNLYNIFIFLITTTLRHTKRDQRGVAFFPESNFKLPSFFAAMLLFDMSQFWLLVTLLILMELIQVNTV